MSDLNEKYLPNLISLLKCSVSEVRKLCSQSMASFLRINYVEKKRLEILKIMNETFLKSKNYFYRMTYLEFVYWCCQFFSRNFLRLNLFPECFKLANDKVANVRIKLASILTEIRKRIAPNDKDNLFYFGEAMGVLRKNIDQEVEKVVFKKGLFLKAQAQLILIFIMLFIYFMNEKRCLKIELKCSINL